MRVAILFTGALRTIKKTIKYFKQNLLLNSYVDVFACIQNDTTQSNEEWNIWLKEQIGEHLKSIEWYIVAPEWNIHREKLLDSIILPDSWKQYLRTSGSMIEYIQLQYAYMKMSHYEQTCRFIYDYIIKSRTDTIYAKPIDFHWLNWTNSDVNDRIKKIIEELHLSKIELSQYNIIQYFMNTIISDDLISIIPYIQSSYITGRDMVVPNIQHLNDYIKNGSYILTIRANNLYIVRRDLFYLIPSLGTMYGLYHYPYEDEYWFNAENQFRAACYNSNLSIFDYSTTFEEKSLYEYDERRYFDLDYNLINPKMLYCVVRN
jgi:hypothetical protein